MKQHPHRPIALDGLRTFQAVAQRLSFSGAAEQLHLTQSAVSRQIKALEVEVGLPLFNRGTRFVELTTAGAALLQAAQPGLVLRSFDFTPKRPITVPMTMHAHGKRDGDGWSLWMETDGALASVGRVTA